jgi:hypothetical protein
VQSTEEAPGPPAESERLQRKSTTKFNRAKQKENLIGLFKALALKKQKQKG